MGMVFFFINYGAYSRKQSRLGGVPSINFMTSLQGGFKNMLQLRAVSNRKTKTKIITLASRNRCKQHNEPIRTRSK